ncbi:BRO family protein, partial [Vibrio anguillarum]
MSLSEVLFSYDSAAGEEGIRTLQYEGKLYFSLFDVVRTIQRENRVLDPEKNSKTVLTLLKAHVTHLLPHEIYIRDDLPDNVDEPLRESYVTKAGLLRVVLQDNSPACLKFQEWVLEDVLPQILETGRYAHPSLKNSPNVPSTEDFDVEAMLRL